MVDVGQTPLIVRIFGKNGSQNTPKSGKFEKMHEQVSRTEFGMYRWRDEQPRITDTGIVLVDVFKSIVRDIV